MPAAVGVIGDTVGEAAKILDVEPHGWVARPDVITQTEVARLRLLHDPRRPKAPIQEGHQLKVVQSSDRSRCRAWRG